MSNQITPESPNRRFPISLGISAGYLIVAGVLDLVWPLLRRGGDPHYYAEFFVGKSAAFKAAYHLREVAIPLLFLIAGSGLFFRKSWARILALLALIISTFYSSFSFAWGFAQGKPSMPVLALSFGIVGAWNVIWFILIFKKTSRETLITQQSAPPLPRDPQSGHSEGRH